MLENRKLELLDYLVLLVRWKNVLISVFLLSLTTSYLIIRFTVESEFTASSIMIPSAEANAMSGLTSLLKDFSAVMPSGLGSSAKESEMDLYNTVIYSRSCIDSLIKKFDLQRLYKIKSREETIKSVRKKIKTEITMENAFVVSVHSKTPQLASDITNYLVGYLNDKIIQLHVAKARDNSLFLSERYEEIKKSLASAEDSLEAFQEKTGIFEATQQAHATIESFAKLESDLAVKQVEYSVLSKVYGENSPTSSNAKISLQEYEKTVNRLKNSQDRSSVVVGLSSLPQKAKYYYKYYRDVKIFDEILGFIVPLYEQSKFDEQRTVPVLQVIDAAVPPEKKSFPPRTIVSLVIASLSLLFVVFFLILRNLLASSTNPKISLIKKDLFHFGNS